MDQPQKTWGSLKSFPESTRCDKKAGGMTRSNQKKLGSRNSKKKKKKFFEKKNHHGGKKNTEGKGQKGAKKRGGEKRT